MWSSLFLELLYCEAVSIFWRLSQAAKTPDNGLESIRPELWKPRPTQQRWTAITSTTQCIGPLLEALYRKFELATGYCVQGVEVGESLVK